MNLCLELSEDYTLDCNYFKDRIAQKVVLMNSEDVNTYLINEEETKVRFNLKEGKRGFLFDFYENGRVVNAEFSKSERFEIAEYSQGIDIFVNGVGLRETKILKELDRSVLIAAVLYNDDLVKIFGFNYGLKTDNYTYETGARIRLQTIENENNPPYIYETLEGTPRDDFDNLFENVANPLLGDFNIDFNNDFYITT